MHIPDIYKLATKRFRDEKPTKNAQSPQSQEELYKNKKISQKYVQKAI